MAVTATQFTYYTNATSATSYTTTSATLPSGAYLTINAASAYQFLISGNASISDSAGGSWTQIYSYSGGGTSQPQLRGWLRTTPGTGSSFTVTITSANNSVGGIGIHGTYFTGATGSISSVISGTGTTAPPSVTTNTASIGDLHYAIGQVQAATTPTLTAGSGFTALANTYAGSSTRYTFTEYSSVASNGTTTATFNSSTATTLTVIQTFVVYAAVTSVESWGSLSIS